MERKKAGTEKQEVKLGSKCCSCGKKHLEMESDDVWQQLSVYDGVNNNSYKYFDVCSLDCYLLQVKKTVEELHDSRTSWIDGMDIPFAKRLLNFYEL